MASSGDKTLCAQPFLQAFAMRAPEAFQGLGYTHVAEILVLAATLLD